MRLDEVIATGEGLVQGAKGEAAAVEITGLAYDSDLNPNLQPKTKLTALKIGVSF